MKITESVEKVQVIVEVKDIVCNKCGESCTDKSGMNYEGVIEHWWQSGYYSKFGDCQEHQFSLCETCLEELYKTFKHSPFVGSCIMDERDDHPSEAYEYHKNKSKRAE